MWEHVARSGAGAVRAVCRQWREAHDGALGELLLLAQQPKCACILQLPFRRFVGLSTLQVSCRLLLLLSPSLLVVASFVTGRWWLLEPCNDSLRVRATHPPTQLVCDGALPQRGLAAALAELAGAPTLRHVHVALCSLADDSVRALCHLESLHTLRCAHVPPSCMRAGDPKHATVGCRRGLVFAADAGRA